MTTELVKDALHRIADRAEPIDGLAERALRGASRRRAAVSAAVAVGTIIAIAAPVALLAQTKGNDPQPPRWAGPAAASSPSPHAFQAPRAADLPADTATDRAVVRACMNGAPSFPEILRKGKITRSPASGRGYRVSDFRVLVSHPVQYGRIVLLGSEKGHRTCVLDRSNKPSALDRLPHQTANSWYSTSADGSGRPKEPVSLEDAGGGAIAYGSAASYEFHVGGLVTPQVAQITLRFGSGTPVTATISHGFFLGGVVVSSKQGTKLIEQSVDVTAYDSAGRVVFANHQPGIPAGAPG